MGWKEWRERNPDLHSLFHKLWGKAVGGALYDKEEWKQMDRMIAEAFSAPAVNSAACSNALDWNGHVWDAIFQLQPGEVMQLHDLSCQLGIESLKSEIRPIFALAISCRILEPVYRLNTELLVQSWTSDLLSLRRCFTLPDGRILDGACPQHIAVGFRRTQQGEAP